MSSPEKEKHKRILVAFLVRNGEKWLGRFLECLDKLDYPREYLKLVAVEGNSEDDSWHVLSYYAYTHQGTWLTKIDVGSEVGRYKRLAMLKNKIVDAVLKDEDFVLWIDSDIVAFPSNLLKELVKANVDIVAPYILIEGNNQFYDTLAFRKNKLKFAAMLSHVQNDQGMLIKCLPDELFEVDSVGTCMLVKAEVYREGVRFPESNEESEQVLFCDKAREKGFKVFADPRLKATHANLPFYGEEWH